MLDKILKAYLKGTGKGYLVPFLNGLSYLGRPSTVTFPLELLEQGLAIVLSGLSNTMAIQSNLDWVWPLWVERQMDPDGEEFIPTAINLIKTNLTCRNWTSIGLENSPYEAMVDPVGMLTLQPYGWSIFPFVRIDGRPFFPPRLIPRWQVTQKLQEGNLPCVITRYDIHPNIFWKSEAMALNINGEEGIGFTHSLTNRSNSHLSVKFGLAIRPYNPLTLGHINTIKYNNGLWKINGFPGLLILDEPNHTIVSDRHHGDPLQRDVLIAGRTHLKSRSGIACGQTEWDLELKPSETKTIETFGLLGGRGSKISSLAVTNITRKQFFDAKQNQTQRWRDIQMEGLRVRLPVERLQESFLAVKNHLHVFDDGSHFSPGTYLYHNHWFRDSAFIALAFENLGHGIIVAPKLDNYLKLQTRDGFFKSQKGEWDSNGQAIWTLINHVRCGGDLALVEKFYPAIIKGVKWIDRMRKSTRGAPSPHYGLMPAGFSAEHFGPNDHYYWDNFWSLAGIEAAIWAAEKMGNLQDTTWMKVMLEDYRGDVLASMDWAWKKQGCKALPCSPYRSLDSAAIGNLIGLSPLGIFPIDAPWVKGTIAYLMENNLREGLFFQRIVHTGLNPYLSVQLARALMLMGDARWYLILEGLIEHASTTYTWPEAMHPRMFGGCMGDGDHGWSAAEFLNLIREMLVSVRPGLINIADAVPLKWYRPGMVLEAHGAPTPYGTVNFTLRQGPAAAFLTWSIYRKPHQEIVPLRFSLPVLTGLAPQEAHPIENGSYRILLTGDAGSMTFPTAQRMHLPKENSHQPRIQLA